MKISLVASSVRPSLWDVFAKSLESNKVDYEIIFVGPNRGQMNVPKKVRPIFTTVKPAQCYEIGFRAATGDLIHWTADDAEYEMNALDNMVRFWEGMKNLKAITAFTTVEDGKDCTSWHHTIGGRQDTPVMAPFGVMSKGFLMALGGYDRRYICGQSENDLVMRALVAGGEVRQSPFKVFVEHCRKHGGSNGTKFRAGPQGWYPHDRKIFEGSWVMPDGKTISPVRLDAFEPFFEENIMTVSQSFLGSWT
jgi:hypothetical protein